MAPSNFVPTINEASGNYKGKQLGDGFMSAKVKAAYVVCFCFSCLKGGNGNLVIHGQGIKAG